jgi:ABC-2 type transport system permease protein
VTDVFSNTVGLATLAAKEVRRFLGMVGQTIGPPLLTSLLYIYIFGQLLGERIEHLLPGVSYIDFIVPGLLMMNAISGAFMQTSFAIYLGKLQGSIQEVLVAPLSYAEMALGYVTAAVARGVVVGLGIYVIAVLFTAATVQHFWAFSYFLVVTSLLFAALGAVTGLWAKSFEFINIPNTFVLLPLSFMGGVFHSVALLPGGLAVATRLNPIFYMVNGIRWSMIGQADVDPLTAALVVGVLALASFLWCVHLFRIGYRLRS